MRLIIGLILTICCLNIPTSAYQPAYGWQGTSRTPSPLYEKPVPGPCTQCRPTERCTGKLDIRDSDVPKNVEIPSVVYQTEYQDKPVQYVADFDVRTNPRPVPVPLQDQKVRVDPHIRTVEKIVTVRVPRVSENVVVKRLDRVKLVTEYRTKPKLIKVQNTRQVAEPVTIPVQKNVVRKKLVPETEYVPVPVRVANIPDVHINRIDKPVEIPSIQFNFCEHVKEIEVKANCPPAPTERPSYLPPTEASLIVGHDNTKYTLP